MPCPFTGNIIRTHWVLKRKHNLSGEVLRYKARLVAQGNTQQEGVDFNEVFPSVGKATTLRVLQALCAKLGLICEQYDTATAFFGSDINTIVHVEAPPDYKFPPGKDCQGWVFILSKSPYGLRQSPCL